MKTASLLCSHTQYGLLLLVTAEIASTKVGFSKDNIHLTEGLLYGVTGDTFKNNRSPSLQNSFVALSTAPAFHLLPVDPFIANE